jgi:hypothetical protein
MKHYDFQPGKSLWLVFMFWFALLAGCAGSYKYITLSDLDFKKCWQSKPGSGIAVWAVKQPLYETGNKSCYQASVKKNVGIFVVKIENTGARPVPVDTAHLFALDGSGNPGKLLSPDTVSQLLGGGQALRDDIASNPLFGKMLEPGKSYITFICMGVQGDPYFATYYLRFKKEDGTVITEARF